MFSASSFLIGRIKPVISRREITGVPGAEISIAVLKAPGHKIELLEYLAPADRKTTFRSPALRCRFGPCCADRR